jgi:hypothetical protein
MSYRKEVTIEMLREMIDYNPQTGDMVWKDREGRARGRAIAGKQVGCPRQPYRVAHVYRNQLYVHRIAFALTHGRWPEPFCDHINGDPSDNRACNLREATHSESARNIRGHKRSRSGVKGVHWHAKNRRWCVRIMNNLRNRYFGSFDTIDEAAAVARTVRQELHGEFARH